MIKKIFLSVCLFLITFALCAQDGLSWKTAYPFDLNGGGITVASAEDFVWYKADLSLVPQSEDVLISLKNGGQEDIIVEVQAFVGSGGNMSVEPLSDAESRTLQPGHNYVRQVPHSTFSSISAIYIKVRTSGTIKLGMEMIEAGEVQLNCLNTPVLSSEKQKLETGKTSWFTLNLNNLLLTDGTADATKALRLAVENDSTANTTVVARYSYECPSRGYTEYRYPVSGGSVFADTIKCDRLKMLSQDGMLYVSLYSQVAIKVSAEIIALQETDIPQQLVVDKANLTEVEPCLTIPQSDKERWYVMPLKDFLKKHYVPELVLENKSDKQNNVTIDVLTNPEGEYPATRSFSLYANQLYVENLSSSLAGRLAEKSVDADSDGIKDSLVYFRVVSEQPLAMRVCAVRHNIGSVACQFPRQALAEGTPVVAQKEEWIELDLTDNTQSDIRFLLENKGYADSEVKISYKLNCSSSVAGEITAFNLKRAETKEFVLRNSLLSLLSKKIYLSFRTNQNLLFSFEKVEPETHTPFSYCDNLVNLDITDTDPKVLVNANEAKYIRVDYNDLWQMAVSDKRLPVLTLLNRSNNTAEVKFELSLLTEDNCLLTEVPQEYTITIGANSEFVRPLTEDLIANISEDVWYVLLKIESSEEVVLSTAKRNEQLGNTCSNAIDIEVGNIIGYDQEAEQSKFYRLDLSSIREKGKSLVLEMRNHGGKQTVVQEDMFYTCPLSDAPQIQLLDLPEGEIVRKTQSISLVEANSATEMYLLLKTATEPISFRFLYSDTDKRESFCEIFDNDVAVTVDWKSPLIEQKADTQIWYSAELDTFRVNSTFAPKVRISSSQAAEVKVKWAFDCNDVVLDEKTISLSQAVEYELQIERGTLQPYLDNTENKFVYFSLSANADITVAIDIVDPNTGETCYHAIRFDMLDGHKQKAGTTAYYRIDKHLFDQLPEGKGVKLLTTNQGQEGGLVYSALLTDCNKGVIEDNGGQGKTLLAGETLEKPLGRSFFNLLSSDYIILMITTEADLHIYAEQYELTGLQTNIDEQVEEFQINRLYTCAEGDNWFHLSHYEVESTEGDATLKVFNSELGQTVEVLIAYDSKEGSEVLPFVSTVLAAEQDTTHLISRGALNEYAAQDLWICVRTQSQLKFIAELNDKKGADELHAVPFDWETRPCVVYPGSMTTKWYRISLDLLNPETHPENAKYGIQLTVTSLEDHEIEAQVEINTDAGVKDALYTNTYYMQPFDERAKALSHGAIFMANHDYKDVFVCVKATGATRLCVEMMIPPVLQYKDTVELNNLCDGMMLYLDKTPSQGASVVNFWDDKHKIFTGSLDENYGGGVTCYVDSALYEDQLLFLSQGMQVVVIDSMRFLSEDMTSDIDSIRVYNFRVLVQPELPATFDYYLAKGKNNRYDLLNTEFLKLLSQGEDTAGIDKQSIAWKINVGDEWQVLDSDFFIAEDSKTEFLRVSATTDCGDVKTKVYTLKTAVVEEEVRWKWMCQSELPKPDEIISETFEQTDNGEVLKRVVYHYVLFEEPKLEELNVSLFATEGDTLSLSNLKSEILPLLQPEQTWRVQKFKEETLTIEVVDKDGNVIEDGSALDVPDSLDINISAYLSCQTEGDEPVTFTFENSFIVLPNLPVEEVDIVLEEPIVRYDCTAGEDEKVFIETQTVTTDEKIVITHTYAIFRTLAFDDIVLPEMQDLTITNGQLPDLSGHKALLKQYFNLLSEYDYVEVESIDFVTAEGNVFNADETLEETITVKGIITTVCGELQTNEFKIIVSAAGLDGVDGNSRISLTPTIVNAGENLHISGLNSSKTYIVEIYNLAGVCVKSLTISGISAYSVEAQSLTGYYMMRIINDEEKASFKYFVL